MVEWFAKFGSQSEETRGCDSTSDKASSSCISGGEDFRFLSVLLLDIDSKNGRRKPGEAFEGRALLPRELSWMQDGTV